MNIEIENKERVGAKKRKTSIKIKTYKRVDDRNAIKSKPKRLRLYKIAVQFPYFKLMDRFKQQTFFLNGTLW